jgi:hypothetical protein
MKKCYTLQCGRWTTCMIALGLHVGCYYCKMILVKMYYHSYLEIFIVDMVTFVAEDVASTKSNSDTRLILSSCCQVAILSLLSQMSHLRDSNVNYDLNWFGRCVDFQFEGGRCTVLLDLCDIVMLIVHTSCYCFDSISEEMVGGGLATARTRQWLKRECILECFNHVNLHCVVHRF